MEREDIQGLWRLVASTADGFAVLTGQSHAAFQGDRTWEVWPNRKQYVDQVRVESTYRLDTDAEPPRITIESAWIQPDGAVRRTEIRRGVFELSPDKLRIAWGYEDDLPDAVTDDADSLDVYDRETDPALVAQNESPPEPLAREKRTDSYFGELSWDANLSWWGSRVDFKSATARVCMDARQDAEDEVFARGRATVDSLRGRADELLDFAAAELAGPYNDTWREGGPPLEVDELADRLRVESIHIRTDGTVELYLDDGGLFGGHVVVVSLDAQLTPYDAGIAG